MRHAGIEENRTGWISLGTQYVMVVNHDPDYRQNLIYSYCDLDAKCR